MSQCYRHQALPQSCQSSACSRVSKAPTWSYQAEVSGMPDISEIRINPAVSLRQRSLPVVPSPVSPAHIERLSKKSLRRNTLCTWGGLLMMVALSLTSLVCALVLLNRHSNASNLKRQAAAPIMNGVNFPDPVSSRQRNTHNVLTRKQGCHQDVVIRLASIQHQR